MARLAAGSANNNRDDDVSARFIALLCLAKRQKIFSLMNYKEVLRGCNVSVTVQTHLAPKCIWTRPNAFGGSPNPKCIWTPHRRTQMHSELTTRAQMHLGCLNTQNTNPNAFGGAKYPNKSPNAFGDANFQIPNAFSNFI